jgi:hypothetical protein
MTQPQETNTMPSPSVANDPSPAPSAEVLFYAMWAVGRPGSGWEHHPSFVTAFNCRLVDQESHEYDEQRQAAEHNFTRMADVDDAVFFIAPMICGLPELPETSAA